MSQLFKNIIPNKSRQLSFSIAVLLQLPIIVNLVLHVSKINERHVFNSFYEYLDKNNLLTEHQSGFRPKHSCEMALHSIIDKWLCNIDEGKLTGVLFIDLSKVFIRPSSDGTYYGMVMSVRPSGSPSVRPSQFSTLFSYML